jgi:hypothetical protein
MNRTAQRKLKQANPDADRAELRQLRRSRGRVESVHAGSGHGKRTYVPVQGPVRMTRAERDELKKSRNSIENAKSVFARLYEAVYRGSRDD